MKYFYILVLSCLSFSCKQKAAVPQDNPQEILTRAIQRHGGVAYYNNKISFAIEDTRYTSAFPNKRALYTMERDYNDVNNKVLYDGGYLKYYKNDSLQKEDSFPYKIIERSLYGTLYGLSIPHILDSKEYSFNRLEDVTIRSKLYYTIKATSYDILEEKDNEIILYISQDDYTLEYLALDYNAIALQKQFRRFTNTRTIKDILFQDVMIFVSQDSTLTLDNYYTHFNNPKLKHTKTIELKDIQVEQLN